MSHVPGPVADTVCKVESQSPDSWSLPSGGEPFYQTKWRGGTDGERWYGVERRWPGNPFLSGQLANFCKIRESGIGYLRNISAQKSNRARGSIKEPMTEGERDRQLWEIDRVAPGLSNTPVRSHHHCFWV